MRRLLAGLSLALALVAADAPTGHAAGGQAKLDGMLRWTLQSGWPPSSQQAKAAPDGLALPVLVRFAAPPSDAQMASLEREGALAWRRCNGRVLGATTVFLARTSAAALPRLVARPEVVRIELDWSPVRLPPLEVTVPLSRIDVLWEELDDAGLPLTGAGVTIGDIDSGVDVSHPALFRRDGDPLAWFDDDGGGYSGNGGEWVDLDDDATRDAEETLRHVEAYTGSDFPSGNPAGLTPGLDWLYADSDGNGQRDAAPAGGWGESSPSLGEPVLVAEMPAEGTGLDPGQPLYRLGQSKVRALRGYDGTVYRRGVDLLAAPRDPLFHGTPVCGILAGGEPGFTRLAGVAPGAELVIGTIEYETEPRFWVTLPELAAWAVAEGADVILVEDGEWVWEFMDGSAAGEILLTELARDQGIVVVAAAGNLAGNGQHDRRHAPPGGSAAFDLRLPPSDFRVSTLWLNLNWRGASDGVSWRLDCSAGSFTGAADDGPQVLPFPGGEIDVVVDTSTAGTHMLAFRASSASGLEPGGWLFSLDNATGVGFTVDAFKWDDLSGWNGFSQFAGYTDVGTVTWPATARGVIVVGAYSGRPGTTWPEGELNSFSGRGPALDGRRLVDLTAPGSTTFSAADSGWTVSLGSWYRFGGTSAALPHVAGVAALLRQAAPEAHPYLIERALQEGARPDGFTGEVPNADWGYGKLDAAAALDRLREIRHEAVVLVDPALRSDASGRVGPPAP